MAKQQHSQVVRFAEIAWFRDLNEVRQTNNYGDKGRREELRIGLAKDGWWKDSNGLVEVESISKDRVEQALADRKQMHDFHIVAARTDGKEKELAVFERLFLDGGKLIKPIFIGVTGNRRAAEFMASQVMRIDLTDEETNKPYGVEGIDDTIAIILKEFRSPLDRLMAQNRENEGRTSGFLPGSPVDQLLTAKLAISRGATQSHLRKMFKDTVGVKLWYMCVLQSRYPDLNLIERCKMKPDDKGFVDVKKVTHTALQSMGQRFSPEATSEYNEKHKKDKGFEALPVLSKEEVSAYFDTGYKETKSGSDKPDRMMDKNQVNALSQTRDNPLVKATFEAVNTNNVMLLDKFEKMSLGTFYLTALFDEGDYPAAEKLLEALAKAEKGKKRNNLEKALLKAANLPPLGNE